MTDIRKMIERKCRASVRKSAVRKAQIESELERMRDFSQWEVRLDDDFESVSDRYPVCTLEYKQTVQGVSVSMSGYVDVSPVPSEVGRRYAVYSAYINDTEETWDLDSTDWNSLMDDVIPSLAESVRDELEDMDDGDEI